VLETDKLTCLVLRQRSPTNLRVDGMHELRFEQPLFGIGQPQVRKDVAVAGTDDFALNHLGLRN